MDKMNWVDEQEKVNAEKSSEGYFDIQEGDNRIQLLTHVAPLPQVWDNTERKYRNPEEGDKNISVKGVCWVLHEGKIKQAKLPYTVVKAVRELMQDPDYAFSEFPMPRLINIKAKNAKTKEVEYTVIPAPKESPVSDEIKAEVSSRPTPEEVVEKIKGSKLAQSNVPEEEPKTKVDYPDVHPEDIPF